MKVYKMSYKNLSPYDWFRIVVLYSLDQIYVKRLTATEIYEHYYKSICKIEGYSGFIQGQADFYNGYSEIFEALSETFFRENQINNIFCNINVYEFYYFLGYAGGYYKSKLKHDSKFLQISSKGF